VRNWFFTGIQSSNKRSGLIYLLKNKEIRGMEHSLSNLQHHGRIYQKKNYAIQPYLIHIRRSTLLLPWRPLEKSLLKAGMKVAFRLCG